MNAAPQTARGREIVIGLTGGIACYKTAALVSRLVQAGHGVSVVMSDSAEHFVGPATFEALTGRPVHRALFGDREFPLGAHIGLAQRAELVCVAPATANLLGKLAHGLADDLLSTMLLATKAPVLLAPAMNATMWEQPSVQRNVAQLRSDGFELIDPAEGWLSCRQQGTGRMAEPEEILARIEARLAAIRPPS